MWIVWKRDQVGSAWPVIEQMCSSKREADRVAKYETKWRGIYGFAFTVEQSPFSLAGMVK